MSENAGAGADLPKCLSVALDAATIMPSLTLNKALRKDTAKFKFDELHQHIKFNTWSTHSHNHPAHMQTVTLSNQTGSAFTFSLAIRPLTVFKIVDVISSAPKHPLQDVSRRNGGGGRAGAGGGGSSGPFTLPNSSTVAVKLLFLPPAAKPAGPQEIQPLERNFDGELRVTYANGVKDEQVFKIHAHVQKPMILVSPSDHRFGAVHVERWQTTELYLSNPTIVDAEWRIKHIPFQKPPQRVGIEPPAPELLPVDQPSVFKFSQVAGIMMGPSLPLHVASAKLPEGLADESKAPLRINVSFKPDKAVHYRSRFRFVVAKGQSFDVVLYGKGSIKEGTDRV